MNELPKRLLSIDVFRSITMFLMIFLLDSFNLSNIPSWIGHAEAYEDRLGFADIIFPIFLFIVGLSLHFAIINLIDKGMAVIEIFNHILMRSMALIIMGFFFMNLENYNDISNPLLSHSAWRFYITLSFFLIWLKYPDRLKKRKYLFIGSGVILLLYMAYIYPNREGLRHSWWGILGMIGWGYLLSATIYLFARGRLTVLIAAFLFFITINILWNMDLVPYNLPIAGNCLPPALIMAGAIASSLYQKFSKKDTMAKMWVIFTIVSGIILLSSYIIRPLTGGISKINSTPAWGLIAIGVGILLFEFFIYIIDVKEKQRWFLIIRPAGTSTLGCYLMTYLYYSILDFCHISFPYYLSSGIVGLIRSLLVSLFIINVVRIMEKGKLRLNI